MHTYTHACTNGDTRACILIHSHTWYIHTNKHGYSHIPHGYKHTHTPACMHGHTRVDMHCHILTNTCTCTHTVAHAHTPAHTHASTHTRTYIKTQIHMHAQHKTAK